MSTVNLSTLNIAESLVGEPPRLRIHSSSLLFRTQPPFLLFWQVQPGTQGFFDMQDLLAIDPRWLTEIAPDMYQLVGTNLPGIFQISLHVSAEKINSDQA